MQGGFGAAGFGHQGQLGPCHPGRQVGGCRLQPPAFVGLQEVMAAVGPEVESHQLGSGSVWAWGILDEGLPQGLAVVPGHLRNTRAGAAAPGRRPLCGLVRPPRHGQVMQLALGRGARLA